MDADGVEISKPGESSFGAAAKDVSVKITTTIDTLVKAIYNFHYEGEDACIGMFPQDGAVIILNKLLYTVKQSKTGLLALDNHDKDMIRAVQPRTTAQQTHGPVKSPKPTKSKS